MKNIYSQDYLKKSLNKLRKKVGRFNLSMRYYRDTSNVKEHSQMNRVFKKFRGKTVLDVGCHIGYYATMISFFAQEIIGIDINEKVIKKAYCFKEITRAKNIDFKVLSAFDLDDKFMFCNKINAVFIHKSVGDMDSNTHWSIKEFEKTFSLFEKHCDIIICNDVKRIKTFFQKDGFSIDKFASYRHNSLYVIKKNKKIGKENI